MTSYQNILCATDFSKNSHAAFLRAGELAGFYGAKLILLHVVEYFPLDRSNTQIAPENTDPKHYRAEQALLSLSEHIEKAGIANVKTEVRFSINSARHEIICYIEEQNVDLVIVASHGLHGINALLGSSANSVVHSAPCDVLVVRAKNK